MDKYIVPAALILIVVAFFYFKNNLSSEDVKNNIAKGVEFLANNRTVEGVLETSSGLQYQVLQPGTGTEHPKASDTVKVHYHGTLLDGTVFDSSVIRGAPISFGLNRVIPGWTEGLQLMVVGEKTRFFIPANLAYGNRSAGKIEGGSLLIFEVELLAINE
ncbi:MAG: FKBP-type peptidyl-prolyl cis-trans isomerase [Kangiellaceae bacterium]